MLLTCVKEKYGSHYQFCIGDSSAQLSIQILGKQINRFPRDQLLSVYSYRYSTRSLGKSDCSQMLCGQ